LYRQMTVRNSISQSRCARQRYIADTQWLAKID
jgi:hypothetical protein